MRVPEQLVEGLLHVVHPAHVPLERLLHLPDRSVARDDKVLVEISAIDRLTSNDLNCISLLSRHTKYLFSGSTKASSAQASVRERPRKRSRGWASRKGKRCSACTSSLPDRSRERILGNTLGSRRRSFAVLKRKYRSRLQMQYHFPSSQGGKEWYQEEFMS